MESKKLEKPCENATFQALQGVMKPDEETGGVFQTMQPFGLPHETQVLLRGFVHIQRRLLRKIANEPFGLIRLLKNVVSSDSHMTLRR